MAIVLWTLAGSAPENGSTADTSQEKGSTMEDSGEKKSEVESSEDKSSDSEKESPDLEDKVCCTLIASCFQYGAVITRIIISLRARRRTRPSRCLSSPLCFVSPFWSYSSSSNLPCRVLSRQSFSKSSSFFLALFDPQASNLVLLRSHSRLRTCPSQFHLLCSLFRIRCLVSSRNAPPPPPP